MACLSTRHLVWGLSLKTGNHVLNVVKQGFDLLLVGLGFFAINGVLFGFDIVQRTTLVVDDCRQCVAVFDVFDQSI